MNETNGLREQTVEEWLTVSEAAKALGKPERTVRRWANRLPPSAIRDRPNMAKHVRLSALSEIMDGHTATDDRPVADRDRPEESALVRALQEEIAFLRKQVEAGNTAQSELRTLMLADKRELQELRQKVALLLPAPPETPRTAQDTPPDASTGISERERAAGVYQDGHDGKPPITGVADQPERRSARRWWNNLFGKRGR